MKTLLFCWSDISGYMVSCWKALSENESIKVKIIAFGSSNETSFNKNIADGLDISFVSRNPSKKDVRSIVNHANPDFIFLPGWFVPAYRGLPEDKALRQKSIFIMTMDTPWLATWRQRVALLMLRRYVRKMNVVLSSGERSYQYAKRLGAAKIYKFQYGVDYASLSEAYPRRMAGEWPKRFLFVGRYVEEKGVNDLLIAYAQYRKQVSDPWELHFCGQGPLKGSLIGDGVRDHGFVQPNELMKMWSETGCLVLPSHYDPWPLIIVEACASGLPVIVTHACGSHVEVVKNYYNGIVISESNIDELVRALQWIHHRKDSLPKMGRASQAQAQPYSAEEWAIKVVELINDLEGATTKD